MPRGGSDKRRILTTVLFTDIVGSTQLAQELGDSRWRNLLTKHHAIVRRSLKQHGGREIDTAGDGFLATFDQPTDAIACATEMIDRLHAVGIDIRAGIHMGEVEVMGDKVGGVAVHIGARVMSKAGPGQLLVSSVVRELMPGSDLVFEDEGFHELKGVSTQMQLFEVRHTPGEPEAQEPALEPERPRRRLLVVAAVVVAAAVGVTVALLVSGGGATEDAFVPAANTIVRLDPATGEVVGGASVGRTPIDVDYGDGRLWVANFDDKTVQSVDAESGAPSPAQGGVLSNPTGIAVGGGSVWVTNGISRQVVRIDPDRPNDVVATEVGSGVLGVAYGADHVWIAQSDQGDLVRLDPITDEIDRIPLGEGASPLDVVVGGGAVWVTDALGGRVVQVDPESLEVVRSVPLLHGQPSRLAFGGGSVWVTSEDADSLTRIDPSNGRTTEVADVGNGPLGVAAGPDGVWVANSLDGTVTHVDPTNAKVIGHTRLGFSPDAVAMAPDGVWVTVHEP